MTVTAVPCAHGFPSWANLKAKNVDRAQEFYSKIFDWEFTIKPDLPSSMDGQLTENFALDTDGHLTASLVKQPKNLFNLEMSSSWDSYIAVQNIDTIVEAVPSAGGRILNGPHTVDEAGRFVTIADPAGAVVRLWESFPYPTDNKKSYGALTWLELESSNIDEAKKFYGEILGWDSYDVWLPSDPYAPEWCYTIFTSGVSEVAGAIKPLLSNAKSSWCAAFAVEDADVTVSIAQRNGAVVVTAPYDLPIGRQAVLIDPDGAVFSVISFSKRFSV